MITPGQIDSLAATFTRTWQRPPTEVELKGLVDDHVRNEMATREAVALGLDRDDTVIARRLRQKLEFLVEDSADAAPVTDADLQAWLERHPDQFRKAPEVAFRQVYLSPDRRGDAAERDAQRLLAQAVGGRRCHPAARRATRRCCRGTWSAPPTATSRPSLATASPTRW